MSIIFYYIETFIFLFFNWEWNENADPDPINLITSFILIYTNHLKESVDRTSFYPVLK